MITKIIVGFIFAAIIAGCGDSLPEQYPKDINLKPEFKKQQEEVKPDAPAPAPALETENKTVPEPKVEVPKVEAPKVVEPAGAVSETVNSVVNYGTGYTHLKVKKTQTEKINKIQEDQNKKLEEALRE